MAQPKKYSRQIYKENRKYPTKKQSDHHYVFKFKVFTGLSSNSTDMTTHSMASSCKPIIWIILSVCSPLQLLRTDSYEIWEETDKKAEAQSNNVIHLKFYRNQTEINKLNWFWLLSLSVGLKICPVRISIKKQKQCLPWHFIIFL